MTEHTILPIDPTEDFLQLLSEYSQEIYGYIFRLVLNRNDADDIFQETNLVLWREFDRYRKGTNFRAWSYRIAGNQVLAWRKRHKNDRLTFSSEFVHHVAERLTTASSIEDRVAGLDECLARLPRRQRELIRLRYEKQLGVETISMTVRRSVDAVYRSLNRIRRALFLCVKKKIPS